MPAPRPSKTRIGNHVLHPETLMLGYGYDPALSEGAVKPPVFLTSTFVFRSAEEGRDFFDYTSGRKQPPPGNNAGLV
jgi:methionine-gamma-lyase